MGEGDLFLGGGEGDAFFLGEGEGDEGALASFTRSSFLSSGFRPPDFEDFEDFLVFLPFFLLSLSRLESLELELESLHNAQCTMHNAKGNTVQKGEQSKGKNNAKEKTMHKLHSQILVP